ncbi:MAG: polysaccharide biosynthesis C-terminal domain-containing protein, partial [Pygmaiobacter sp.]
AVYSFLNSAVGAVPKYFCERMLGTVQFSYFSGIFAPVVILQVGATYLFVPFITTFARLWNEHKIKEFCRGLGIVALVLGMLGVFGMGGVALLGRWALGILYFSKPEILPYADLLYPLVLSTVVTTFVLVLCHLLTILREMRGLILGNVIGILASLLLSPPLLARFGIYGAAYATLAAAAAQAITLLLFLVRRCKKESTLPSSR